MRSFYIVFIVSIFLHQGFSQEAFDYNDLCEKYKTWFASDTINFTYEDSLASKAFSEELYQFNFKLSYILLSLCMSKFTSTEIKEELTELKELYRKQKNYKVRTRIQSLIYSKEGKFKKRTDLAQGLGIDYSTLKRWSKEYKDFGLEHFLKVKSGGVRRHLIDPQTHQLLLEKLHDSKDPLLGYFEAVTWLKREHQISIKYHTLRSYMIRHFKTKLKHPRKSHYKKDEQAIEAFKKTTQPAS